MNEADEQTILNTKVLQLHQNKQYPELAALYFHWGQRLIASKKEHEGCFFLTQGYILSLELGLGIAQKMYLVLKQHGREE